MNPQPEKPNPIHSTIIFAYNKNRNNPEKLCYAPFSSIAWYQDGHAAACCFNREHILGRYPQQSLKDIWFGAKANELRKQVAQNNLDLGCFDCKNHLLTKNYGAVKALNYDYLGNEQVAHNYPLLMDFLLSNTCNLECQMCSGVYSSCIRANREKLPATTEVYDENFAGQLAEFLPHLKWANFSGGEPFLITSYFHIWDKIATVNPHILCGVTTNGTVLNNRIKDWLSVLRFNISISIDSLNAERFASIRRNAVLERVLENFLYFRDYTRQKGTGLTINTTPMITNWMDIPDIVRFANQHRVQIYFTNMWQPPAFALWNKSTDALTEIFNYLSANRPVADSDISRTNDTFYGALLNDIAIWKLNAATLTKTEDAVEAESSFRTKLNAYIQQTYPAQTAAVKLAEYLANLLQLKNSIEPNIWERGICLANEYPVELWAGELEVSKDSETLKYSFLNFSGYYLNKG